MIFYIIFYVLVLSIYMACPFLGKLIIAVLNCFLPDPLPMIDEVIMIIGLINGLERAIEIVTEYWAIIVIGLIIIAIVGIVIWRLNSNNTDVSSNTYSQEKEIVLKEIRSLNVSVEMSTLTFFIKWSNDLIHGIRTFRWFYDY